jgi:phage gp29-like protein
MAQPPTSEPPRQRRSRRSATNEAVSAIPPTVISIFNHAASTGDTSRQTRFYKDARILDSRLDAVCATRTLAIQGRPIVFKPPPGFENNAEAKKIASNCSRLWNSTRRTTPALGHLAHGVLEGHAGLALKWGLDPLTGWSRPEFLIDQSASDLFIFDPDTLEPWFSVDGVRPSGTASDTAFPLSSRPDSFIFFSPVAGRADYPWRRGALRACVIRSLLKRLNIGHWTALLERWGQPQVVAIIDWDLLKAQGEDDVDAVVDEVNEALRAVGRDWRASLPKGVEIKEIAVSVAENLHKNYVDWANTEDAIAVLGQNLSTEAQGGSFAAASAHNRIRIDILASDCLELAEAITDQWAEPVVRYNWPGAPVPYAEFVLAPRRELQVADYQAGLCTADQWLLSNGHEAEPDGKGQRYYSGPLVGASPTANPGGEPAKPSDTGEPGASKPEGGEQPSLVPVASGNAESAVEDAAATGDVAGLGLNGAQIKELKQFVIDVASGVLPRESALGIISVAFPTVTPEQAAKMLPPASFTPATPPA